MIHESVANQLGLTISPSTQIATQADGKSEIDIIGEVRFQVTRDNQLLHFEGLVARKMDTEALAGIPFITQNNISIHPARNVMMINDTQYPYGNSSAKACVARVKSFVPWSPLSPFMSTLLNKWCASVAHIWLKCAKEGTLTNMQKKTYNFKCIFISYRSSTDMSNDYTAPGLYTIIQGTKFS